MVGRIKWEKICGSFYKTIKHMIINRRILIIISSTCQHIRRALYSGALANSPGKRERRLSPCYRWLSRALETWDDWLMGTNVTHCAAVIFPRSPRLHSPSSWVLYNHAFSCDLCKNRIQVRNRCIHARGWGRPSRALWNVMLARTYEVLHCKVHVA